MTDIEFRRVFHENKDAVYNFALRLTGSAATAEDLVQDCFLAFLRSPSAYDPKRGSMRAFLLGITRNLAHQRWRQESRTEPLDEDVAVVVPDLTAGSISRLIAAAIQSLPPMQREVVLLFEYEGFTLEEIAAIVNADIGTVKSRLHRARDRLRRMLAPLRNSVEQS